MCESLRHRPPPPGFPDILEITKFGLPARLVIHYQAPVPPTNTPLPIKNRFVGPLRATPAWHGYGFAKGDGAQSQ